MSRIGTLAIALALLALGGADARAQTPEERARLERLERRYHELQGRRLLADSLAGTRHDTLRVATFLVLTDSAASPLLLAALADVEGTLTQRLGARPLPILSRSVIAVRFGPPSPEWGRVIADGAQFVQVHANATPPRLAAEITQGLRIDLMLHGGLASWRADLRLFEDREPLWEATYIELATGSLPGNRACNGGDLAACAYALGLLAETAPRPPGATAGLGRYVESRFRQRANQPALTPLFGACVQRDDPDACVEFLDLVGVEVPRMSTRAAGTVLFTAMDLGGDDALLRFFADTTADIATRLSAAAGAPLDTVLAAWRATALGRRPAATTMPAGTQWLALFWTAVLTMMATRSTRWR